MPFRRQIASSAYGWENASMSGIFTILQLLSYFHPPTAYRRGAMTAALLAGEFGASLLIGFLFSDRLGRLVTILHCVLVYLVGQGITTASMIQATFITGLTINRLRAGGISKSSHFR